MSDPTSTVITYILRNGNNKYYVGKTNNINRRMKEHQKDRLSNYYLIWSIFGDHEMNIKHFGVSRFYNCMIKGNIVEVGS